MKYRFNNPVKLNEFHFDARCSSYDIGFINLKLKEVYVYHCDSWDAPCREDLNSGKFSQEVLAKIRKENGHLDLNSSDYVGFSFNFNSSYDEQEFETRFDRPLKGMDREVRLWLGDYQSALRIMNQCITPDDRLEQFRVLNDNRKGRDAKWLNEAKEYFRGGKEGLAKFNITGYLGKSEEEWLSLSASWKAEQAAAPSSEVQTAGDVVNPVKSQAEEKNSSTEVNGPMASTLSDSTSLIQPKSQENTSPTRTKESSNRFSFYAVVTGLAVAGAALGAAMSRKVS